MSRPSGLGCAYLEPPPAGTECCEEMVLVHMVHDVGSLRDGKERLVLSCRVNWRVRAPTVDAPELRAKPRDRPEDGAEHGRRAPAIEAVLHAAVRVGVVCVPSLEVVARRGEVGTAHPGARGHGGMLLPQLVSAPVTAGVASDLVAAGPSSALEVVVEARLQVHLVIACGSGGRLEDSWAQTISTLAAQAPNGQLKYQSFGSAYRCGSGIRRDRGVPKEGFACSCGTPLVMLTVF